MDLVAGEIELEQAFGHGGESGPRPRRARRSSRSGRPSPLGAASMRGYSTWRSSSCVRSRLVARDPPAFEDGQAAADRAQADPERADDRGRQVHRLSLLRHGVAADVQHDGTAVVAISARAAGRRCRLLVRPEHVCHQAGIEAEPAHGSPVAVARHDPHPAFGAGHPAEGHRRVACTVGTRRRRLNEHDVVRRDGDVVLPGRALEFHGLHGAQGAGRVPLPDAQPDSLCSDASSPAVPSPAACVPSSTENRTRPPSAARRCTWDAMGTVSPPVNSSGSKKREYCEGNPDSGRARSDPDVPEDPGVAGRFVAAVPHGLPVA